MVSQGQGWAVSPSEKSPWLSPTQATPVAHKARIAKSSQKTIPHSLVTATESTAHLASPSTQDSGKRSKRKHK